MIPQPIPGDLSRGAKIKLTWIAGDRWLVTASGWGFDPGEKAQARWIDAEKNTVAEIVGFECPSVLALTGDDKGGGLSKASISWNSLSC